MNSVPNPSGNVPMPKKSVRLSARTILLAIAAALLGSAVPVGFTAGPGFSGTPDIPTVIVMGTAVVLSLIIIGVQARGVRAVVIPPVAALICGILAGPYIAAALLALTVASAVLGLLSVADRVNPLWFLAVGAVSYGISFVLTHDAAFSVLSLLPCPTAAFLVHANTDRAGRAEIVARVSAGLFLSAVLAVCLLVFVKGGYTGISSVLEEIDAFRPTLRQMFLDVGAGQIDEKTASALADTFFNLLPAIVLVVMEIGGYLIQLLEAGFFHREATHTGKVMRSAAENDLFRPSAIGGTIYVLASVVTMFGTLFGADPTGKFLTVMDNFMLVLLLPMGVCGVQYIIAMYRAPAGRFRLFPILFAVLAVFLYGILAVPILFEALAFLGGVSSLFRPVAERIEKMKRDGGQNG